MSETVAILAAMESEIRPLVVGWRRSHMTLQGRQLPLFESDVASLLCGGIGYESGKRAAEALLERTQSTVLMSVGLAGALRSGLRIGEVIRPAEVINAATGQRFDLAGGHGAVVTSSEIADVRGKQDLARRFPQAVAVDMEGAAVAEVAQARGLQCALVKTVSDELEFPMPPLGRFVDRDGQLHTVAVAAYAAARPWLWPAMLSLARNSSLAAERLARAVPPLLRGNVLENLKLTTESRVY